METVKLKSAMSEEDIKQLFLNLVLNAQRKHENITMEEQIRASITDGEIVIKGTSAERKAPKKADYMLFMNRDQPIAIADCKRQAAHYVCDEDPYRKDADRI